MEAWRLTMKPWKVYRPVMAVFHHFSEELNPDPHRSEKLYPDTVRIKVMQIGNPVDDI
jgi:hypothetical protein